MIGNKRAIGNLMLAAALAGSLIVLSAAGLTAGQRRQGMGKGMPAYDPSTEVSLVGSVEEVQEHDCDCCPQGGTGIHLLLRVDSELLDVHLGPASFLQEKGFEIVEGEQIEVLGSKVEIEGAPAFLARRIEQDGRILLLRDEQGRPLWSRGADRLGRSRSGCF